MTIHKSFLLISLLLLLNTLNTLAQQRIVTDTITSEILGAKRAYTVILPASYYHAPERSYPVLYLLHGMWGKNTDWAEQGHALEIADLLAASGEACEMVIVTPDAGGGDPNVFRNGYFDMDGWAYERFFFEELMPMVESRFRTIGDKRHRAVAGLSMGGGGATVYAQRHTGIFCAAYAMSALMNIPDGDYDKMDMNSLLAKTGLSVMEHSAIGFVENADVETLDKLRTVSWFVDCGDDDFLLDRNIEFYQAMRRKHVPCQFRVRDGGHQWEYWRSALYHCLPFVSRCFKSL